MNNIYFIRHGQTDRNKDGIMNPGDVDSELNETGIDQAIHAGIKAKEEGCKFDIIISSPLKRAMKTAKLFAEHMGYTGEILIDERLKEQLGGALKDYSHEKMKQEFDLETTEEVRRFFKDGKNNKAEDILNFRDRIINFYEEIKEKYKNKTILLVGHSGVSRVLLSHSQNLDFDETIYISPSVENSKLIKLA